MEGRESERSPSLLLNGPFLSWDLSFESDGLHEKSLGVGEVP